MKKATLKGGQVILAHDPDACDPNEPCAVHRPSDHHMTQWPQNWRDDRGFMERICPHGVGHPDPDGLRFIAKSRGNGAARYESIHGCDGCCLSQKSLTS